jgi:hypothetical protein
VYVNAKQAMVGKIQQQTDPDQPKRIPVHRWSLSVSVNRASSPASSPNIDDRSTPLQFHVHSAGISRAGSSTEGMMPNRSVSGNDSALKAVDDVGFGGSDGMEKVLRSKDGALLSGEIMGADWEDDEDELVEVLATCPGTSR